MISIISNGTTDGTQILANGKELDGVTKLDIAFDARTGRIVATIMAYVDLIDISNINNVIINMVATEDPVTGVDIPK